LGHYLVFVQIKHFFGLKILLIVANVYPQEHSVFILQIKDLGFD